LMKFIICEITTLSYREMSEKSVNFWDH
jgi:hypothetical protein